MNKFAVNEINQTLQFGEDVTFGMKGSVSRFKTRGFDLVDGDFHSWTENQTAEIEFGLRLPNDLISVRIDAVPFLTSTLLSQQVFVYLNGLFVGFSTLPERQLLNFGVDRSAISSRSNRLTFVVPTAATPAALGLGNDQRCLGIALISLCFVQAGAPE